MTERVKSHTTRLLLLEQGIETERISPISCIGNADYLDTKPEEEEDGAERAEFTF